ncbi:MAG: sulfotransferase [Rubrobacter sp.]
MKLLFIGGPPRSGTTALADYLNQHPELLVCIERYKWVPPHEVRPELFTFERILDYRSSSRGDRPETNTPREHHVELLAGKDPQRLAWIGDKTPAYVEQLRWLSENNPGASFILTYRPLEDVAESFEARAKDPEDPWLLGGFETGVEQWNAAMKSTRNFVKSARNLNVLILSYHDFFYNNQAVVPLLSRFLDIEIDQRTQDAWTRMSRGFEARRRTKEPLSEERRAYIRANKNEAAERWMLNRMRKQRRELELYSPEAARTLNEERRMSAVRVSEERRKSRLLEREVEELRARNLNSE